MWHACKDWSKHQLLGTSERIERIEPSSVETCEIWRGPSIWAKLPRHIPAAGGVSGGPRPHRRDPYCPPCKPGKCLYLKGQLVFHRLAGISASPGRLRGNFLHTKKPTVDN